MLFHGLSAYSKAHGLVHTIVERALTAQRVEACWSDERLGPVGLAVNVRHADIKFGCCTDAFSFIDEHGDRVSHKDVEYGGYEWDGNYDKYGYKTHKKVDTEVWVQRVIDAVNKDARRKAHRYAEFSAIAEADCVWYDKKYGRKWYLIAKRIAYTLGVPVFAFE